MKNLILKLTFILLFVVSTLSCSRVEDNHFTPDSGNSNISPHFYGAAMLGPEYTGTKGVANTQKIWNNIFAEKHLTVKFLNGTAQNKEFVKEVASEWEKYAGIRLRFLDDESTSDALFRVGFDMYPGMMSSWALTGTDHLEMFGEQDEPTIHFALWPRVSEAVKRSDVLRAFGQALGLELEFRHPRFNPSWIVDNEGNIDEEAIRSYWENELSDYISWEELKEMVLDPLSDHAFFISKTPSYDPLSVMNWPFYQQIAENLPLTQYAEDYNTELSENDKSFIRSLYGESFNGLPDSTDYYKIMEFDLIGTSARIYVQTYKDIVFIWDEDERLCSHVKIPAGATLPYSDTVVFHCTTAQNRRVKVGEMLEYGETRSLNSTSNALDLIRFEEGRFIKNIIIPPLNMALRQFEYLGGPNLSGQTFTFTGLRNLRAIFLAHIQDSNVSIQNCINLKTFGTSRYLAIPSQISGPSHVIHGVYDEETQSYPIVAHPYAIWSPISTMSTDNNTNSFYYTFWPSHAEYLHSISSINQFSINTCQNLEYLILENTRLTNINLNGLQNLKYVYVSSENGYIVGGLNSNGDSYLANMFQSLPSRNGRERGQVIVKAVSEYYMNAVNLYYGPILMTFPALNTIESVCNTKNWLFVPDSGGSLHD